MHIIRHLTDWLIQRIFWLSILVATTTAQADVILWESIPQSGNISFTPIAGGEIRSQEIDLTGPAIAKTINLNAWVPPFLWFTGGPSQISLWLDSTPAQRQTLIYTGEFRNSWTGLAVALPAGRSYLSLENLTGSQTINWNQEIEAGVPTRFHGKIKGVPVPEPEMVVLLACCFATGIFCAWRASRGQGR